MDCLFCDIAAGKLATDFLYDDDRVVAFQDIEPQAPEHILIIPRKHIATINDADSNDTELLGHMIQVAKKLAGERGIADDGYRLVFNCNKQGGQLIYHIHLHLLGGRAMQWPPG